DRAGRVGRDQGAVRAHLGVIAPALVEQQLAGLDHAALDQPAERDARLLAPGADVDDGRIGGRDGGDALARAPRIVRLALDADPAPAQLPRHRARRAGAEERVDRKSTRLNSSHGKISYAVF